MSTPDMPSLRLLLLHRLPDAEAQQLEERLMLEEQLAGLLREAEHDLLDDYASGRLFPEERLAVEKYLLATPADRQRLKVARALARLRDRSDSIPRLVQPSPGLAGLPDPAIAPPARRRWTAQWPVRVGGAIAAGVILSLGLLVFRMKTVGPSAAVTATVVLLADAQRGSTEGSVNIHPSAERVRLQVEIPAMGGASTYTLAIADRGGRLQYEVRDLLPRHAGPYPYVEAVVPANALKGPRCRITLTGAAPARSDQVFAWDLVIDRR